MYVYEIERRTNWSVYRMRDENGMERSDRYQELEKLREKDRGECMFEQMKGKKKKGHCVIIVFHVTILYKV